MTQWMGGTALALALAAAPAAAQMSKGPDVQAEIQALLDESAAAWNRGDLKGHLADNADSIRFMTGKGPVIGKGQTEEILRKAFFRDGKPIQSLRFEQVDIRPLGTEHALVIGHFILSGGGEPDRAGWFSTVWERQSGGWRVIHDHSS
jgi:ketosteroid isomerase-like protein